MHKSIFKDIIGSSWLKIFDEIDKDIMEITENEYQKIKNEPNIYPPYEKIFNFTNYCSFEDTKVLICGQDPYPNLFFNKNDNSYYPQATGLAFSVPKNCPIPPSLVNIYDNLRRFGHHKNTPTHGNLEYWASQGVILMNTSLTVEKSKPNSHQSIWSLYSDELIKAITKKHSGLIIVLWGGNAISKMKMINNKEKHNFVISSHPSPLGYKSKIKNYDSFYETNHFAQINDLLKKNGKKEIDWQIY
jgi:uracil-DNA glycosylase